MLRVKMVWFFHYTTDFSLPYWVICRKQHCFYYRLLEPPSIEIGFVCRLFEIGCSEIKVYGLNQQYGGKGK